MADERDLETARVFDIPVHADHVSGGRERPPNVKRIIAVNRGAETRRLTRRPD